MCSRLLACSPARDVKVRVKHRFLSGEARKHSTGVVPSSLVGYLLAGEKKPMKGNASCRVNLQLQLSLQGRTGPNVRSSLVDLVNAHNIPSVYHITCNTESEAMVVNRLNNMIGHVNVYVMFMLHALRLGLTGLLATTSNLDKLCALALHHKITCY